MLVYFTASVTGKKYYLSNYLKIIEILREKKCKVISDHIIQSTVAALHSQKKEDRLAFHKNLDKWLKQCDFVVAETTFPSVSVGYEISLALHYNKPILILYFEGKCPSILVDHSNERLVCENYTLSSLQDIIEEFISFAQGTSDSRFTFFITPAIAAYLDKVSKKHKIPKSVFLRKLIEDKMRKK